MSRRSLGARFVRLLARCTSFCYPTAFRRQHGVAFADVADRLLANERTRRAPLRAVLSTSQVILGDALSASPAMWMEAIASRREAPADRSVRARFARFSQGSWQDLKLAARSAIRRPAFSLLVIGTLGLGIGSSAAAFDALDRAILNPLPFVQGDDLVLLVMQEVKQKYMTSVPLASLQEWRKHATTVDRIEIFRRAVAIYGTPSGAVSLDALAVSGGLPELIGVRPLAGRAFTIADADPAAPATVMLGEQFWRTEFGGDPSVVGRVIRIASRPTEIIGVWPIGARLDYFEPPDVIRVLPAGNEYARGSWVQVLARRRPDRSNDDVQNELRTMTSQTPGSTLTYAPVAISPADLLLGDQFVTGVWLVFAGGVVLLAAAIANAAHLLLERANARGHELAVRIAIGGSTSRLFRLFFAEGVVYACGALVAGLIIALGLEALISEYEPRLFRDVDGAGLAGRAFAFVAAIGAIAAIVCSVAPVFRSDRRHVTDAVNQGHGRTTAVRSRGMQVLVGLQAAVAALLVFGAMLMGRSLLNLLAVNPGIETDRLAELSISMPAATYPDDTARALFLSRAREALETLPGVTGVVTSGMPIMLASLQSGVPRLEGEPEVEVPPHANTALARVRPHYFHTLGLRLRAGRFFTDDESDVAVVGAMFAAARGNDVLGKRLLLPRSTTPLPIVGVVDDVRYMGLSNDKDQAPSVYVPAPAAPAAKTDAFQRFIIRTEGDPAAVLPAARRRLAEIDPQVPILEPQTGAQVMRRQTAQHRFVAAVLGGLAVMGFLLAMSGVYGAVALSVVRRTREIGVRMALGATAERLVRRFVAIGLRPVAIGALCGSAITWLAAPHLEALLFRVPARDPLSGASGLALVLVTAALAALGPARRIARVDPAKTLRAS
ncbi:MAG TPA: ABC transporter permease [Vicinamibacterales bacterium]|nr:ABC transporter permease [Vicinamibacterales bacterium]